MGSMTQRSLPPLPCFDHWPAAVRSAERLRGTLLRCGPGVRGVGWPETPRVRAAALRPWLDADHVAVRLTAAWVWGVCREPGHPLEFSTLNRRRPERRTPAPGVSVHQFAYAHHELSAFAPDLRVTTPAQTACDLLRNPEAFDRAHLVAVRLLIRMIPGGSDQLRTTLRNGRAQYRAVALRRLDSPTKQIPRQTPPAARKPVDQFVMR